ncbi:MAG: hypothetical protein ACE5F6_00340 [Anaerolineae bacterium]
MSNGNVPLQLRGGRNYDAALGILKSFTIDQVKIETNEIVVLEGTDDLDVVQIADAFLGIAESGYSLRNNTDAPIDAALFLEDRYGSSIKVDEQTAVPSGTAATLEFVSFFSLRKGDRLVVRVTGSVTAGDGILLIRSIAQLSSNYAERLTLNEKITQTAFRYPGVPGVAPAAAFLSVANFSAEDVGFEATTVFPDGSLDTQSDAGMLTAEEVTEIPIFAQGGIETQVQLDSLPSSGYLYGAYAMIIPTDRVLIQPPLNG